MCGIFCVVGKYLNKEDIIKDFNKIKYRGPDETNIIEISQGILGFHRLSIVDLSKEALQPYHINDTYSSCNGEIYNYKFLKEKYNLDTITNCDCEVIPHLYNKKKFDFINELDGVFAFIIIENDNILVARDRIGVRPLFWKFENGNFCFSSEMKSINSWSEIQVFPPAHYFYNGQFVEYYSLIWKNPVEKVNYNKIKILLENAVEKRLMSDVPIGILLSGGLDSSIIAAIVTKKIKDIESFAIGLEGSPDLIKAAELAKILGTKHHEVHFTLESAKKVIEKVIYNFETYDITTIRAGVPMYLLSTYIKENTNIKVILSGEGSDELFGGYLYFHEAPDPLSFHNECNNLVQRLHRFDVLRADRSTASCGLEIRVPFLDTVFVDYIMNLEPSQKMNGIEKKILRKAFEEDLPDDILYRQKEQFSDGVGYNWISFLKKFNEKELYKKIYDKYFSSDVILQWKPKWGDTEDASGKYQKSHKKNIN